MECLECHWARWDYTYSSFTALSILGPTAIVHGEEKNFFFHCGVVVIVSSGFSNLICFEECRFCNEGFYF